MTDVMEKPVTRGELFGEFLPTLMEQVDQRFEQARIQMVAIVDKMGETLREEMLQLSKTNLREFRDDLKKFDDKYNDLPARVSRLEDAVFKPTPIKRRRSR